MDPQRRRRPDLRQMRLDGVAVLEQGLTDLPSPLDRAYAMPLWFWINETCGSVQYLFHFTDEKGVDRPADVTFEYVRAAAGWAPTECGSMWNGDRTDVIGSPTFMRRCPQLDIEASSSSTDHDAAPGCPAIVVSGFHSPAVTTIRLIQNDFTQERDASGHFGGWTVCTARYRPLRVEAVSAEGTVLGHIDEPRSPANLDG